MMTSEDLINDPEVDDEEDFLPFDVHAMNRYYGKRAASRNNAKQQPTAEEVDAELAIVNEGPVPNDGSSLNVDPTSNSGEAKSGKSKKWVGKIKTRRMKARMANADVDSSMVDENEAWRYGESARNASKRNTPPLGNIQEAVWSDSGHTSKMNHGPSENLHDAIWLDSELWRWGESAAGRRKLILGAVGVLLVVILIVTITTTMKKNMPDPEAKFNAVATWLIDQGVSSENELHSHSSFQYEAANFLANNDRANLPVPDVGIAEETGYLYLFRYVMALNYFALNGPNWRNQFNFLSGLDVCEWKDNKERGVICENELPSKLILDANNLQGKLPLENGLLISLSHISMAYNKLAGSIPPFLVHSNQMTHLNLKNNQLSGSIPGSIGASCQDLEVLDLANNALLGSIPTEFGKLTSLEYLDVSNNMLSGEPERILAKMKHLKTLQAGSNKFEGLIDDTFLLGLDLLERIDIPNNRFTTVRGFPDHFFHQLPSLTFLDISRNNLRGPLPIKINPNPRLSFVSLFGNMLDGVIPNQLGNLHAVEHLDLSKNQFFGPYPEGLGNMTSLRYLSLAENQLMDTGPVPHTYDKLTDLEYLSLRDTNLNGTMPSFIGGLVKLKYLDLSNNRFSNGFPLKYLELENMEVFLVNGNPEVSGYIPVEAMGEWMFLTAAFFDGMNITGSLEPLCPHISNEKHEVIYADCLGDFPAVECSCCECCPPGKFGCSQQAVSLLDAAVEVTYQATDSAFPDILAIFTPQQDNPSENDSSSKLNEDL